MHDLSFILTVMNDMPTPLITFEPDDRRFVFNVARRIVGQDDADDVTQEALLLAYRHRDSFRGGSRYRTWLYRIAVTAALGHLRRKRRSRLEAVGADVAGVLVRVPDPAKSAELQLLDAEQHTLVRAALAELPSSYRDVLLARADANEHGVAVRLGISVSNVKVRTHRARKQLREHLDRKERAAA